MRFQLVLLCVILSIKSFSQGNVLTIFDGVIPPNVLFCDTCVYEHISINGPFEIEVLNDIVDKKEFVKSITIHGAKLNHIYFLASYDRLKRIHISGEIKSFDWNNLPPEIKTISISGNVMNWINPWNKMKVNNATFHLKTNQESFLNSSLSFVQVDSLRISNVDLQNVYLKDLKTSFVELQECRIDGISNITGVFNSSDLKHLRIINSRISSNQIVFTEKLNLLNLESLEIVNSKLTNLELTGLNNLSLLNLSNNKIRRLDLSELPNLNNLDVSFNKLRKIKMRTSHSESLSVFYYFSKNAFDISPQITFSNLESTSICNFPFESNIDIEGLDWYFSFIGDGYNPDIKTSTKNYRILGDSYYSSRDIISGQKPNVQWSPAIH